MAIFPLLRVQYKGGYYSPDQLVGAGTIQGRVLFKGGNYLRNYGILHNVTPSSYAEIP